MLQSVVLPNSVPEAIAALSAPGSALLAGGTVLMPRVNAGDDAITTLVSLKRAGLTGVRVSAGSVEIGTATTLAELAEADALAFLRPALDAIASPTIRNMATVGGNLFAKQPYGDLGACLIALDAQVTIKGAGGARTEPVAQTVAAPLAAGEIATAITFSLPAPDSFRFAKAGRKALNAAAIVTVAAIVEAPGGIVGKVRIGLGGVGPHALRAISVERALIGRPFDDEHVRAAAAEAANGIDPSDDAYASAWYRARVTPVHIRRALLGA
jgi:CO/xanthine dehydrogenase FAD-binding subunit